MGGTGRILMTLAVLREGFRGKDLLEAESLLAQLR
jgi:hypothetical protein